MKTAGLPKYRKIIGPGIFLCAMYVSHNLAWVDLIGSAWSYLKGEKE